ncbi:unnamed protein product [Ixodes persulcatus]
MYRFYILQMPHISTIFFSTSFDVLFHYCICSVAVHDKTLYFSNYISLKVCRKALLKESISSFLKISATFDKWMCGNTVLRSVYQLSPKQYLIKQ